MNYGGDQTSPPGSERSPLLNEGNGVSQIESPTNVSGFKNRKFAIPVILLGAIALAVISKKFSGLDSISEDTINFNGETDIDPAPYVGSSLPHRGQSGMDPRESLEESKEQEDPSALPSHPNRDVTKILYPHLVYVLMDDVGYNDVGYGSSDLHMMTPFIDDISGQGIRFGALYGQPICTPARASLLTGKYPIHMKMQHWQVVPQEPWGLPTQEVILPQYLRKLGYKTYSLGKWHLGHYNNASTPLNRGFDYFYGFYSGGIDYVSHISEESCDDGDYHDNQTCYWDMWENYEPQMHIGGTHNTYLLQDKANTVIMEHPKDKPMFLYVSFPNAHLPLQVPDDILLSHNETLKQVPNLDRRKFAGLMISLDQAIANLTDSIKQSGLYDQTIMVVQSDNGGLITEMGGGNNYPLRGEKKYVYEGGVRVHGFIHSPLIPNQNRHSWYGNMFHISDWLPTILEGILGLSLDNILSLYPEYVDIDGVNHWNAIIGDMDMAPRDEILYNIDYLDSAGDYLGYYRAALRVGDWKLIWNEKNLSWYTVSEEFDEHVMNVEIDGRVTALYNITEDPHEQNDLKDENPMQMKKMLQKIQEKYLPGMIASGFKNIDPGCYKSWDHNMFMGPWVGDEEEDHSLFSPAARIDFENDQFDQESGEYNSALQDPEIQSWIDSLSLQLRDLGIEEEDEPHWEDEWWKRS